MLALVESTSVHFDSLRGGRASELGPLLVNRLAADWVWMPVAAMVFGTTGRALAAGGWRSGWRRSGSRWRRSTC